MKMLNKFKEYISTEETPKEKEKSSKKKLKKLKKENLELLEKYEERTEEIISLLKEKSEGLWASKEYYDAAMELKEDNKSIKQEKAERQQEINALKKQWGEMGSYIIKNGICKRIADIGSFDEFIIFCQLIQFVSKEELPTDDLLEIMKKLEISKEDMEKNYASLYTNLKMKDWQI